MDNGDSRGFGPNNTETPIDRLPRKVRNAPALQQRDLANWQKLLEMFADPDDRVLFQLLRYGRTSRPALPR